MAVEWTDAIIAGSASLSAVGGVFVWHYNRIEAVRSCLTKMAAEMRKQMAEHAADDLKSHDVIHNRINEVKDEYVRRADYHPDIERLEGAIASLGRDLTARMDQLLRAVMEKRA